VIEPKQLFPRSDVGVVAPWLVIAADPAAPIRIDLRLVDRIALYQDDDDEPPGPRLLLTCRGIELALSIADGPEAIERIVAMATPFTRRAGTREPLVARPRLLVLSSLHPDDLPVADPLAGIVIELSQLQTTIGRDDENHVVLDHRSISRYHARITRDPDTGRSSIVDGDSSNHVHVNGERCRERELRDADIVDLGHVRMCFLDAPPGVPEVERFGLVGPDPILRRGEHVQIGTIAFRIAEVEEYALAGANLPFTNRRASHGRHRDRARRSHPHVRDEQPAWLSVRPRCRPGDLEEVQRLTADARGDRPRRHHATDRVGRRRLR
jgi:hypothetical protein